MGEVTSWFPLVPQVLWPFYNYTPSCRWPVVPKPLVWLLVAISMGEVTSSFPQPRCRNLPLLAPSLGISVLPVLKLDPEAIVFHFKTFFLSLVPLPLFLTSPSPPPWHGGARLVYLF